MNKILSTLFALLVLGTMHATAQEGTWSFKWDTSRSSGGEGFYHMSDNEDTLQVESLNGLQWTFQGNTSVTAYTGTAGQYFGSAKSPVKHATLSTQYLIGKIKEVRIQAKKKEGTEVGIGVKVAGQTYPCAGADQAAMTTEWAEYTFAPTATEAEGEICITMDQTSETTGPIYFLAMTIVYDGEGVRQPVKEPVLPDLAYAMKEYVVEAGDNVPANPLTNPYGVSPIKYSIRDASLATLGSTGAIYTTGRVGKTTVQATFAGNDDYLPQSVSYTLKVVAKPVIAAPDVDVPAGTYTEPITVTITSTDTLCKAIWYSTVARDSAGLVEKPVIVAGNKAVVRLDETCTLRCCAVDYNNIGLVRTVDYVLDIPLTAAIDAEESRTVYYRMGWDSVEEASTWRYFGISGNTWTLTERCPLSGTQPFSIIDPESKYSLSIYYTDNEQQRERAVSPQIEVRPSSTVEFYACFNGIWLVFADWSFIVNDLTTGTSDQLLSAFRWAQENEFTGPNWINFQFDLEKYAGHTCTFEFIYEGRGGDDMSIDGFRILQADNSADAVINIVQGASVHFQDASLGHPDTWQWTFQGGEPATSNEQNPVVTYERAGVYDVTLTVGKDGASNTITKKGYIVVGAEAPKAHIGLPEGAYLSPWAMAFVPVGVPLTYHDESTGRPDTWLWTFQGTDTPTSTQQHPTVTYTQEGQYGLKLEVSNSVGADTDFLIAAIKAGGALDVWNILPEESGEIAEVQLGWYGSYAGSNWLGMQAFAERFDAPLVKSTVDKVTVYFASVQAEDQNAPITVSLCLPDADGMPGEAVASATLLVSQLHCDAHEVVPTDFVFDTPVQLSTAFFITIDGFPHAAGTDNVAVLCAYRGEGKKSTTYHLLEDEDANYNSLGTYTWYENNDEPLSLALTAHLTYANDATDIAIPSPSKGESEGVRLYDLAGRALGTNRPARGIYIVRPANGKAKTILNNR